MSYQPISTVAVTNVGFTSLQIWTCVAYCVTDTLNSDVIAVSAAAKQTPNAIQMTDIKVCVEDKIVPVLRQAPQHEGV
jgi:tRNA A37 threonylcarbamoyladenosine dehydratase